MNQIHIRYLGISPCTGSYIAQSDLHRTLKYVEVIYSQRPFSDVFWYLDQRFYVLPGRGQYIATIGSH